MTEHVLKHEEPKPIDENAVGDELTVKQERFCVNYTQNYELFGNATLSYAEAFGFDLEAQRDDDAQYQFSDGSIYAEWELEDFDEKDEHAKDKGKKIQDSSYRRMYDNVSSYASKLRKNLKIQARCRELLNEFMRDDVIDARLTEIALKGEDKDAINAIKEYNKLKQRIVDKVDHTSKGEKIAGFEFIRAEEPKPQEIPQPTFIKPDGEKDSTSNTTH